MLADEAPVGPVPRSAERIVSPGSVGATGYRCCCRPRGLLMLSISKLLAESGPKEMACRGQTVDLADGLKPAFVYGPVPRQASVVSATDSDARPEVLRVLRDPLNRRDPEPGHVHYFHHLGQLHHQPIVPVARDEDSRE